MKGREKMVGIVLGVLKCLAVLLLIVAIGTQWYENAKDTAFTEAEERIERAVRENGRPIVKVDVIMKGKWE